MRDVRGTSPFWVNIFRQLVDIVLCIRKDNGKSSEGMSLKSVMLVSGDLFCCYFLGSELGPSGESSRFYWPIICVPYSKGSRGYGKGSG